MTSTIRAWRHPTGRPRTRLAGDAAASGGNGCGRACPGPGRPGRRDRRRDPRPRRADPQTYRCRDVRRGRPRGGQPVGPRAGRPAVPATLPYHSELSNRESARRAGISPASSCAAALDAAVAETARRDGCQTVLRASYLDQLGGVVFTIGVLAFPTRGRRPPSWPATRPPRARSAGCARPPSPGTDAASFDDAARQAALSRPDGPYAVLTVAGYADGRLLAPPASRARPRSSQPASWPRTSGPS